MPSTTPSSPNTRPINWPHKAGEAPTALTHLTVRTIVRGLRTLSWPRLAHHARTIALTPDDTEMIRRRVLATLAHRSAQHRCTTRRGFMRRCATEPDKGAQNRKNIITHFYRFGVSGIQQTTSTPIAWRCRSGPMQLRPLREESLRSSCRRLSYASAARLLNAPGLQRRR